MRMNLYAKKDGDRIRYWIGVNSKDMAGNYVSASIPASMSDEASKLFMEIKEDTKNADIKVAKAEVTDFWFKAVQGKDRTFAVVFVNKIEKAKEKDTKGGSW